MVLRNDQGPLGHDHTRSALRRVLAVAMAVLAGLVLSLPTASNTAEPNTAKSCVAGPNTNGVRDLPLRYNGFDVVFSGCAEVKLGPVCEIEDEQPVALWLPAPLETYRLSVNGSPAQYTTRPVQSGFRVELAGVRAGDLLEVVGRDERTWRLKLDSVADVESRRDFAKLRRAGDITGAARLLAALSVDADPRRMLWVRRQSARLDIQQARFENAEKTLSETAHESFGRGEVSAAANDVFAVAFILLRRGDLQACRKLLGEWENRLSPFPTARALSAQHWGTLARLEGRLADALVHNIDAEREALRLGAIALQRMIAREQTSLLTELGDFDGALAANRVLIAELEQEPPCVRANVWSRQAWLLIQQARRGAADALDVDSALTRAAAEERACGDNDLVVNGLLNRGLWATDQSQSQLAARYLEDARHVSSTVSPQNQLWLTHLAGLVAVGGGEFAVAYEHFNRELVLGVAADSTEARMRALSGLGRTHAASGHPDLALANYQAAFAELRGSRSGTPLGELANDYFASRAEVASHLVDAWLERGLQANAFAVAKEAYALPTRISETRATRDASDQYASLLSTYRSARRRLDEEAAEDWKLTNQELAAQRARRQELMDEVKGGLERLSRVGGARDEENSGADGLPPDELWILPFPGQGETWQVFVAKSEQVNVVTLERDAGRTDVAPLTRAVESWLDGVKRVAVLATGASKQWDFEGMLAATSHPNRHVPVVFRVTGGPPTRDSVVSTGSAAVVADPRGDLPFARREGELVATTLGIRADRALEGSRATAEEISRLLETSDWFHYAGHAEYDHGRPRLLVANGETLEAWEFLALDRLPQIVVLSACDAAVEKVGSFGASWNLATALATRGAALVVAPSGALDDRDSLTLHQTFYEALAASGKRDWASVVDILWSAQRRTSTTRERPFRLFVR